MSQIKMLTGVVEVGLFCHMAKAAYFGNKVGEFNNAWGTFYPSPMIIVQDGSVTIRWNDGVVQQVSADQAG